MRDRLDNALERLRADIATCHTIEAGLRGKTADPNGKSKASRVAKREASKKRSIGDVLEGCIRVCKESRKKYKEEEYVKTDLSDYALSQLSRFTHGMALAPFARFLHYVPRLVNVVTLAEALPMPGSGISLPLDLRHIASRCKGSFYAPKRFAAVQLAYSSPRARVLVFHTGRLVGTGCGGASAARLAIARAQRQLAEEADVNLHIRNFAVINQVGAVSLRATLNCDAFATEHSSTSHFDKSSFVGLAWRPPREHICCEIYSTGRANLPGSVAERQLLESFSRMLPELLRFSSANHLLSVIPEALQEHHRRKKDAAPPVVAVRSARQAVLSKTKPQQDLWEGWEDSAPVAESASDVDEEEEEMDLDGLGL